MNVMIGKPREGAARWSPVFSRPRDHRAASDACSRRAAASAGGAGDGRAACAAAADGAERPAKKSGGSAGMQRSTAARTPGSAISASALEQPQCSDGGAAAVAHAPHVRTTSRSGASARLCRTSAQSQQLVLVKRIASMACSGALVQLLETRAHECDARRTDGLCGFVWTAMARGSDAAH